MAQIPGGRRLVAAGAAMATVLALAPATSSARGVPDRDGATRVASRDSEPSRSAGRLPRFKEYVALGDSWTAGVVILSADGTPDTTYAPIGCAQSHRNFPKLVARELGVRRFRDASCGSARTRDLRHRQTDLPIGAPNPPQLDRLSRRTDLVTIGIGGNDVGIASAGLHCLNLLPINSPLSLLLPWIPIPVIGGHIPPLGGCKDKYTQGGVDQLTRNARRAEGKVIRALRTIRRMAPRARILLVDYLRVIPDHACYPLVPATDEDMRWISNKVAQTNAMLRRAARKAEVELVNTAKVSRGHDLCQGARVRYAETLGLSLNDPAIGFPAHPNSAGTQAQATAVLEYLRRHRRAPR